MEQTSSSSIQSLAEPFLENNRLKYSSISKNFQHAKIVAEFALVGIFIAIFFTSKFTNTINSHLWWGSFLSLLSSLVVNVCFFSNFQYRRHPAPMICAGSIANLLLSAVIFITSGGIIGSKDSRLSHYFEWDCKYTSWITEFAVVSAESWWLMISVDLFLSVTNPFTSFQYNLKCYQLFVWSFSAFMAILLQFGPGSCAAHFVEGICWIGMENPLYACSWVYFFMWIIAYYIIAVCVLVFSIATLRKGGKGKFGARDRVLNSTLFCISVHALYLSSVVVLACLVFGLWDSNSDINFEMYNFSKKTVSFLFSAKGFIDLIVWIWILPETSSDIWDKAEIDIDLSPQLNHTLRKEIVHFTTLGIRKAVDAAENATQSTSASTLLKHKFVLEDRYKFVDYRPQIFQQIRKIMNVDRTFYQNQISHIGRERLNSGGGSGAFIFFTADNNYIVKTVSLGEQKHLHKILNRYAGYLQSNSHSLIVRIYGSHSLQIYGQTFRFLVMQNIFNTDFTINLRYDIKGSWVDRRAKPTLPGSLVNCRHCDQKYRVPFRPIEEKDCPLRMGPHQPNVVFKDNDLTARLQLPAAFANQVMYQLFADSEFLSGVGVMDYSLLVGVHHIQYDVDPYTILRGVQVRHEGIPNLASDEACVSLTDSSGLKSESGATRNVPWAANQVIGPGLYYLGIVDILQTWNWRKKVERVWKTFILCKDKRGLSCIPPQSYKERFQVRIKQMVELPKNGEEEY